MLLPAVIRSHTIETILLDLEAATAGAPPPAVVDAVAELRHLREQQQRTVALATLERDRRMAAEASRDEALQEAVVVRRAWVAMALAGAPPSSAHPYPDATG